MKEPLPALHFWKKVSHNSSMCEECGARPAKVWFSSTDSGGQQHRTGLCAQCARSRDGMWIFGPMLLNQPFYYDDEELEGMDDSLADSNGADSNANESLSEDFDYTIEGAPFEALMDACFSQSDDSWDDDWETIDENPTSTELENAFDGIRLGAEEANATCPGCDTTWAQVRQSERVGCAKCYATFRAALSQLFEQVQREGIHLGKAPRAAQKRRRRLEHLRSRRDHQLQMLQNRLADAVKGERYEDAALLRDKIKVVSSSLF